MFRLPELRRLFHLWRRDADPAGAVDRELDFHLAMRIDELVARGMTAEDARAEALRRFGDLAEARDSLTRTDRSAARAAGRLAWFADLGRDLRFATRELRRSWSVALLAVLVLGVGVGLATAMVSIFDRLVRHPLPYPAADRLGVLWMMAGQGERTMRVTPNRRIREAIAGAPGIERIDAHRSGQLMIEVGGAPDVAAVRTVSRELLAGLGAEVALGRGFLPEDETAGSPLTAVLSHRTWRRRFGGRPDVVGATLRVDGVVATVIGVLRPGFDLASLDGDPRAELWLPLRPGGGDPDRDGASILLTLPPGADPAVVAAGLDRRIRAALGEGDDFARSFRAVIVGADQLVDRSLRRSLALLLAAVGLTLLVACANVAALLLGLGLARLPELGVRAALGAGRLRVARQLLAESLLLGGLGLAAALGVAAGVLALARRLRPESLLTVDDVAVGGRLALVAVAVSAVAVAGFAVAPVWALARRDAAVALLGRVRRARDGRGSSRLRSVLVVGQIAVTLVLVLGAGLLVKSFLRERDLPLGFEVAGLAKVDLALPERAYPTRALRAATVAEAVERVRRVPGVTAVTAGGNSPVDYGVMRAEFLPEGRPWPEVAAAAFFPIRSVSPDYFSVIGLPLVAGRTFGADTAAAELIIDEATARRHWGGPAAVGARVKFSREGTRWHTVVGVVATVRAVNDAFEGAPVVYGRDTPGEWGATLLVRLADDRVLGDVSRAVRAAGPEVRIRAATTIGASLDTALAATRFTISIVSLFALVSLGLALVGLAGVIAFSVRQRWFEFGVRLALGAAPARVTALVVRDGLARLAGGVALGLVGSIGLVRLLRGMLYRMSPWDPWVFGIAALGLVAVGVIAAWVPARRAGRVDPLEAIRAE